jgi:hypothetical protein
MTEALSALLAKLVIKDPRRWQYNLWNRHVLTLLARRKHKVPWGYFAKITAADEASLRARLAGQKEHP